MLCVGLTKIRKKETYICETCRAKESAAPTLVDNKEEIKSEPIETSETSVKETVNEPDELNKSTAMEVDA